MCGANGAAPSAEDATVAEIWSMTKSEDANAACWTMVNAAAMTRLMSRDVAADDYSYRIGVKQTDRRGDGIARCRVAGPGGAV